MFKEFSIIVLCSTLMSCSSLEPTKDVLIAIESQRIAQKSLIIDTHIDTPSRLMNYPLDISKRTTGGHFDFERASEGGLNLAFMSLFVPQIYENDQEAKNHAVQLLQMIEGWVQEHPNKFSLVRSVSDTKQLLMSPKVGLAIGLENGAAIGSDLSNISYFANRGVKYITLTHSKHNQMGDSSGENKPKWNGLSPFGQLAVIEMQKKGVMIDVSHVADSTYYQVLDLIDVPVIASHSSCRKLTPDYKRNMTDEMLRALAKNGGVIQINFGAAFLKPEYKDLNDKLWITYEKYLENHNIADFSGKAAAYLDHWQSVIKLGSVRDLVDHIDHAIKVAGIDHVGLGSDFDGVIPTPTDVPDVSGYPKVVAELLKRGYSETDIQKILSGNILRVWKEVELYSNEHT
jgi:membrane dipeptidase